MCLLFGFIFIVYLKKRALVSAFRVFVFCDKCQYFGYQSVIIYIEDFCRFTVEGNKDGSQSFSGRVRFKFDICVNIHPCLYLPFRLLLLRISARNYIFQHRDFR